MTSAEFIYVIVSIAVISVLWLLFPQKAKSMSEEEYKQHQCGADPCDCPECSENNDFTVYYQHKRRATEMGLDRCDCLHCQHVRCMAELESVIL